MTMYESGSKRVARIIRIVNETIDRIGSFNVSIPLARATDEELEELRKTFPIVRRENFGYVYFSRKIRLTSGKYCGVIIKGQLKAPCSFIGPRSCVKYKQSIKNEGAKDGLPLRCEKCLNDPN